MRLSRLKALYPVVALTMACHESTTPLRMSSGVYHLESINGRPVPTFVHTEPAGTSYMLSATLTLDGAGSATRVERWRHVYPPNPTDEGTFTAHVEYRITGNDIEVGSFTPCPINAICEGNKFGKLTATTLTLAYDTPTAPVFLYRIEPGL